MTVLSEHALLVGGTGLDVPPQTSLTRSDHDEMGPV